MRRVIRLHISNGIILVNTILIFVTGLVIILITATGVRSTVYTMADTILGETGRSVEEKTLSYLRPAENAAADIGFLVWKGHLDERRDLEAMLDYFGELLKNNEQFKMVYFADTSGNLFMTRRMGDGSLTRRYVRRETDRVSIRYVHENPANFAEYGNSDDSLETGYDPRTRPWYLDATAAKRLVWTSLYIFATDRQPGFSCAYPVYMSDGNLRGVVAIDIGVADLSFFLGKLDIAEGAKLSITDRNDLVVALQAKGGEDVARLMTSSKDASGKVSYAPLKLSEVDDAVILAVTSEAKRLAAEKAATRLFSVSVGGTYLATTRALPAELGSGMTIGIAIPEDGVMGIAKRNNLIVVTFSLLMIFLAILVSALLSRSIAQPMRILSEEMGKIKDFELDSDRAIATVLAEINDMQASFESMKQGLKNFRKYVPADLVSELLRHDTEARLGGKRKELTVFFSDIADFTGIAEKLTPEALVGDLCEYFEVMSRTIQECAGTLDKYIGDSIMAFWGAPKDMSDHAVKACMNAVLCRDRLSKLRRTWENRGKIGFSTRMGLSTGEVVVGNMGYENRMNFTCIGDGVNTASRLEGLNKVYRTEILVSSATWALAKDTFEFRLIDRVAVKGKTNGIDVYELVSLKDDIHPDMKKLHRVYEQGLAYYFDRNWNEARRRFAAVLKYKSHDVPARLMMNRIAAFMEKPPVENWNGVFESHEK